MQATMALQIMLTMLAVEVVHKSRSVNSSATSYQNFETRYKSARGEKNVENKRFDVDL